MKKEIRERKKAILKTKASIYNSRNVFDFIHIKKEKFPSTFQVIAATLSITSIR